MIWCVLASCYKALMRTQSPAGTEVVLSPLGTAGLPRDDPAHNRYPCDYFG